MRAAAFALLALAAPVPAQAADPQTETTHTVQPGETLGGIANRAQVPRVLIIEANGLKAPYAVKAGQKLVIPRRRNHTVKPGETGFDIALDYGVTWSAIAAANGLDPKAAVKAGQKLAIPTIAAAKPVVPTPAGTPAAAPAAKPAATATLPTDTPAPRLIWPLRGEIARSFVARGGDKTFHDGIDIAATRGAPVRAAAEGKVIFAGAGPKEYGQTVIVYHRGRWTTTYGFLGKIAVKDGQRVLKGQELGQAGTSGLAPSPALHFEVRRNRVALDPVGYLPPLP